MRGKNVLIVEDDEAIQITLRLGLELEGYTVQAASNGKEALEVLARVPSPCLILLDLMMPVMDGWEFASVMRSDDKLRKIPIAVITAFDERARKIEAQAIIKKPIGMDTLLETVGRFCG